MSLKSHIPLWLRAPRSSVLIVLAVLLLAVIAQVSPAQLPVVLYKVALITLAAVLGYWIDRIVFPYARPDSYLFSDWRKGTSEPEGDADFPIAKPEYIAPFCVAQIRRAIVIGGVVLAAAMGL